MKAPPEDNDREEPPRSAARNTPSPEPDSARTQVSMRPISPVPASAQPGTQPIDPDDAPTMVDTRYRRHLLARGVDDPYVDQDQMEAISFESSLATFSPARHESAYFDDQPSISMRLSSIVAAPTAGQEAVAEDEQPSMQMRALKGNAIAAATMILTASFIAGRVLGLFRNSLFAGLFGASVDADAYTQAFYIPDTIFNLVSGGALLSAFIPIFTQYMVEKRDKKTAYHVANVALNTAVAGLTIFAILGMFLAPVLVPLYVLNAAPGELNEIVSLVRIMLLQPIFLGASTVLSAILQTRQRFLLPAIATVLYNVGLILGLCATLLDNRTHLFGGNLGIYGATWGVVLGAALQLLIQFPGAISAGLRYRPTLNFLHPGMRSITRLMVPRIVNAGMLYLAFGVDRALASLLSEGSAYGFFTAFQLMLLPISIFAMAVSTAAFPTLATLFAANEFERLRHVILTTLRGILFLSIPASLGLIGLARPIIRLLLQHGNFNAQATSLVYDPLIFLSIGIAGHASVEILTRSFYALRDSRTPVYVSLCQFAFMIGLSILLFPLGLRGLGLAMSIGVLGEATALLLLLRQRLKGFDVRALFIFTVSVLAASLVSTLAALVSYAAVDRLISYTGIDGRGSLEVNALLALRIGAGILAACIVYIFFARFLEIDDAVPMLSRITRRFSFRRKRSSAQ
ncbi:MAG TPA: murein biosynthesis integral membrane protein MurJ [Ktedonobacterales bacterium]|jgi:putative peptidoglycan lipid II flippase